MSATIHVLLIEDSDKDAALIVRELRKTASDVSAERVDSRESLERALMAQQWDIVLADHELPSFDAIRALEMVRKHDTEVSFVIVSGTIGEEVAVKAMRAGAQDYVMKDRLARLGPVVMREMAETKVRRDRARAIEDLRESEARKAAMFETALDAVITMDHRGLVVEFNPAAEKMFGREERDAIGKELAELIIPPAMRDAHRRGLAKYLATGEGPLLGRHVDCNATRRDGTEFPVELAIVRIARPGPPVFTGFIRDVTDRKKLEARQRFLAEASVRLVESLEAATMLQGIAELVVEHLADGCTIELVSERGNLQRVAAAVRKPVGDGGESSPQTELPANIALQVMREGKATLGTSTSVGGIGSYVVVPMVVRNRSRGVITVVVAPGRRVHGPEDLELVEDLAARCAMAVDNAKLFEEVRESVRLRDDFIAIAAHELRTPLTPLRMQVQALMSKVENGRFDELTPERLARSVHHLVRSTDRLVELVERLLVFSQLTVSDVRLNLEEHDLVALASEVVGAQANALVQLGSTVVWNVPQSPIKGQWDGHRVKLAIRNLLANAMKFAPGKPIELSIRGTDCCARLSVKDHGPGLPEEQRARLFERYQRRVPIQQYGGFGLGLWIVRRVADEHGGRVEVQSAVDDGAEFTLILPRHPPRSAAK